MPFFVAKRIICPLVHAYKRAPLGQSSTYSRRVPSCVNFSLFQNHHPLARRSFSVQVCKRSVSDKSSRDHPFYNYTSGRWLYNESIRLSERRLFFNVDELCNVVSKAANCSSENIVQFTKIAEGGSFRVFEVTFRDGLKLIARLPYPATLPKHYGIASEVATMEYLRLQGLPIPKVLDWNSSLPNVVGAEYIIMEKVEGNELDDTWVSMSINARRAVMEKIVDVERQLFDIRFPACGSLHFRDFLGPHIPAVNLPCANGLAQEERFCIGPSTEYLWWFEQRNELGVNGGPWRRPEDVLRAVADRELEWLKRFGHARYPYEPLYREIYDHQMVEPKAQQDSIIDYQSIASHLVPSQEELRQPLIRHPDFSPSNIFINAGGEITGVIDWQHTAILPQFLQAKIPKHFQNYGDDDSESLRAPRLASNFTSMTEAEKATEAELYRRRQVHYFYVGFTSSLNKPHFNAIGRYSTVLRSRLYDTAGRPWDGDNTSLKAELTSTMTQWSMLGATCTEPPISYSQDEIKICLDRDAKQKEVDLKMQILRDFVGVNIEGWVPMDSFADASERAESLKKEVLEEVETDEEREEIHTFWPFQDHEESN